MLKNGTLYNNLTIWYMYYAFTQNIAYCYTYKKYSVFSLYSSVQNSDTFVLFYISFLNL